MQSINFSRLEHAKVALWGFGAETRSALIAIRERYPEKRLGLLIDAEQAEQWDFTVDPYLDVITGEATPSSLGQFHVIVKSPGISPYEKAVEWARFRGTRFVSNSHLWFAEHPHLKTICVTGSKGKSTTTSLIAHLLRKHRVRTALCGNIGLPLLDLLAPEPAPEWWAIELSSYQTYDFEGVPACAVVLNLFPEHLNWHNHSVDQYFNDKLRILADGRAEVAVLNAADAELMARTKHIERKVYFNHASGWHVHAGAICRSGQAILPLADVRLSGSHNASNVCAALAALEACGFDAQSMAGHARSFQPLPHRLQRLGNRGGVEWVNDSIATTPHATMAALDGLSGRPTTVIVGGFDRGLPWESFAEYLKSHAVHGVVVQGQNGPRIAEALAPALSASATQSSIVENLTDAVTVARKMTPPGGTVLLSPGAPSFDQFADYAARGRAFANFAGFEDMAFSEIEGIGVS
jgi:UDP-N-acetylmuramoylalanine--D-glutamate ligase